MGSRLGKVALGSICIGAGAVTGFAGVLMAWDARLHNAIVANTVENPWPGYLVGQWKMSNLRSQVSAQSHRTDI